MGNGIKPLDFGGQKDHITLGLWLGLGLRLRVGGGTATLRMRGRVTRPLFKSNNFPTSAALAEVCALLSAIFYTVIQKNTAPLDHFYFYFFLQYLLFLLTDFNNFFNVETRNDKRIYTGERFFSKYKYMYTVFHNPVLNCP